MCVIVIVEIIQVSCIYIFGELPSCNFIIMNYNVTVTDVDSLIFLIAIMEFYGIISNLDPDLKSMYFLGN